MPYKCLSLCSLRGFTAGFCKNFVQRFQKFKMRLQGKAKNFDLFRMRKKFRVQVERNFPTLSHERFSIVEPVVQFEKLLGNIIVFINGVAGGFLCLLHRYFVRLDFLRLRHICKARHAVAFVPLGTNDEQGLGLDRACEAQRSNESPSGAFKRQRGLAQARWRGLAPTSVTPTRSLRKCRRIAEVKSRMDRKFSRIENLWPRDGSCPLPLRSKPFLGNCFRIVKTQK